MDLLTPLIPCEAICLWMVSDDAVHGTVAAPGARLLYINRQTREPRMAMQVRTSGCMFSIIASIVLTVLVNVMLRGCSTGGGW